MQKHAFNIQFIPLLFGVVMEGDKTHTVKMWFVAGWDLENKKLFQIDEEDTSLNK
ncbi:hypothetical protein RBJ15_07830 [Pantoea sp. BS_4]|uniref:hypothetical protein n=1 Tax=unclassified Pantoea TaxID=2630326 RepID=UPI0035BF596A